MTRNVAIGTWDLDEDQDEDEARACVRGSENWPRCSGWFFMPSAAEPALFDASICLHALASRGVVRYAMLDLADAGAFKKLVVGPWVGSIGPPLVCTGWLVPSAGDALLALIGRVVPPAQLL
ncbi:hypothetical protein RYX36_009759 [Vicia faba]